MLAWVVCESLKAEPVYIDRWVSIAYAALLGWILKQFLQ